MDEADKAGARKRRAPAEGESNVVSLPMKDRAPIVTKKQLAAHFNRSERWIEQRVQLGMPKLAHKDRLGRSLYDLRECEVWLAGHKPQAPRDRVAELQRDVEQLKTELAEIRKAIGLKPKGGA
jgi:phage terminase Nu1 subunit (DNA packaging protein)